MAGKAGRSGGYRPGSGPKSKPPEESSERDPLNFLLDVMQGKVEANPNQLKAAIAAAQYVHQKKGEGGKKDAQADKARKAAGGKFASAPPPLRVVGGS